MKFHLIKKSWCIILLIISALALICGVLFLKLGNNISLTIFPSSSIMITPINDLSDGGNSQVTISQSDSVIFYSYHLRSGFTYPYAGIKLILTNSKSAGIDLYRFNTFHIDMKMSDSDAIRIFLKSYDPALSDISKPNTYWYHEKEFVPKKYGKSASFGLHDFTIPTWWKLEHNITVQNRLDKLKSVNHIEILNGFSNSGQDSVSVTLKSIYLTGKNKNVQFIIIMSLIILWIATLLSWLFYLLKKWTEMNVMKTFKSNAISSYKKINTKPDEERCWERLVQVITENYFDPELDIETVAKKAGTNRKDASSLIRKFLNTNFKGYLNELRLTEASRLLRETDKQITEIALSVGYNNISHFSRIFKEKFNLSPKESRDRKESIPAN